MQLYRTLARRFGHMPTSDERRRFIAQSLAVGSAMLLSGPGALARQAGKPATGGKRIVIVGGGFSGLAAAHELASAGYDVTVIEARDWIGGRVHSFNAASGKEFIPGRNIEGGAELIGSNHPLWIAYKEKFGLEWLDVSENEEWETPIVLDGKRVSAEDAAKIWEEFDTAVTGMNEDSKAIDADKPWTAANAAELDAKSIADVLAKIEMSEIGRKALASQFSGDNGVANEKASYLGMLTAIKGGGIEKYWSDTEVWRCKGGNQQLAYRLAEPLGKRVITGLPVTSIAIKNDKVTVTCSDSRTLECDDVVLAVPPSTWKKIDIKPGLPGTLNPQMGVNVKYLTQVKKKYWEEAKTNGMALLNGDVSWAWDATDAQDGDGPAGLTAFSGGPAAERARGRKGAERDQAFAREFDQAFPGFSDYAQAHRFMDWPADPWTNAGYSFPAPGQVTTVGPILAAPHANRLHFAGEHACYKFVGYMEGALCSGVTVAKRLAVRDGVAK